MRQNLKKKSFSFSFFLFKQNYLKRNFELFRNHCYKFKLNKKKAQLRLLNFFA